jgi:hypothetical protein
MFFEFVCKCQQIRLRHRSAGGGLGLKNAYVIIERTRAVGKLRRLLDEGKTAEAELLLGYSLQTEK